MRSACSRNRLLLEGSMNSTPVKGVLDRRNQHFKTLILPSQNKHERSPKNVRLRSWLEQNADSGGSMNAKSHITTFKWRHINAFPVHLSSNNSLEQCAVHAHEIVFFSREAWTVLPWRAFWIGVLNQRFKTLILPSQNKHKRSLRCFGNTGVFLVNGNVALYNLPHS